MQADWVDPLTARRRSASTLHTIGPNSQGYLTLGGASSADRLDLPDDPDDERVGAPADRGGDRGRPRSTRRAPRGRRRRRAARRDHRRPDLRHRRWRRASDDSRAPTADGDTTYLCTAGIDRTVADRRLADPVERLGFGCHLVEPNTGINLHNRGIGFNLMPVIPRSSAPGRRPPHTLSPALATAVGGALAVGVRHDGRRRPAADPAPDRRPSVPPSASRRPRRSTPPVGCSRARHRLRHVDRRRAVRSSTSRGTHPADWVEALAARGHRVERRSGMGLELRPRPRDRRRTPTAVRRRRRPTAVIGSLPDRDATPRQDLCSRSRVRCELTRPKNCRSEERQDLFGEAGHLLVGLLVRVPEQVREERQVLEAEQIPVELHLLGDLARAGRPGSSCSRSTRRASGSARVGAGLPSGPM